MTEAEMLQALREEAPGFVEDVERIIRERDEARAVACECFSVADFPRHAQFQRDAELMAAHPWLEVSG